MCHVVCYCLQDEEGLCLLRQSLNDREQMDTLQCCIIRHVFITLVFMARNRESCFGFSLYHKHNTCQLANILLIKKVYVISKMFFIKRHRHIHIMQSTYTRNYQIEYSYRHAIVATEIDVLKTLKVKVGCRDMSIYCY